MSGPKRSRSCLWKNKRWMNNRTKSSVSSDVTEKQPLIQSTIRDGPRQRHLHTGGTDPNFLVVKQCVSHSHCVIVTNNGIKVNREDTRLTKYATLTSWTRQDHVGVDGVGGDLRNPTIMPTKGTTELHSFSHC